MVISYISEIASQGTPRISKVVAIDGECLNLALKYAVERLKSFPSRAAGVGNDPEPVASVRCANGGSRNAVPLRIIPDLGQPSENSLQPSIKQRCDVLHDDVPGSKLANDAEIFDPKAGPSAVKSEGFRRVGNANVLAGEAAADDINADAVTNKSVCGEGSHVVINRNLRPVLRQDPPAVGLDLAKGDGLEATSPLQPEREAANSREKVEDAKHHFNHICRI